MSKSYTHIFGSFKWHRRTSYLSKFHTPKNITKNIALPTKGGESFIANNRETLERAITKLSKSLKEKKYKVKFEKQLTSRYLLATVIATGKKHKY